MTVEAVRAAREPTSYFTPAMAFPRARAVVGQRSETDKTLSSTTDVTLAAGPTVVALAAIGFAFYQQGRGFRHEREMADLDAVRRVLDDAATALHEADYARGEVMSADIRHGRWLLERARESVERLRQAGRS